MVPVGTKPPLKLPCKAKNASLYKYNTGAIITILKASVFT